MNLRPLEFINTAAHCQIKLPKVQECDAREA